MPGITISLLDTSARKATPQSPFAPSSLAITSIFDARAFSCSIPDRVTTRSASNAFKPFRFCNEDVSRAIRFAASAIRITFNTISSGSNASTFMISANGPKASRTLFLRPIANDSAASPIFATAGSRSFLRRITSLPAISCSTNARTDSYSLIAAAVDDIHSFPDICCQSA